MTPLIRSVPSALLVLWAALELVRAWRVRRRPGAPGGNAWDGGRLALWTLRPWAAWAAVNLLYRRLGWSDLGNARTFPLYAHLWREDAGFAGRVLELLRSADLWQGLGLALAMVVALVGLARGVARERDPSPRRTAALASLLAVAAFTFWTAVACLPRGAWVRSETDPGSYLLVWHRPSSTFLYAMPRVQGIGAFLRDFEAIQPQLRRTIHGVTHPPGAALSLYAIGKLVGAASTGIRQNATKLRYGLGLTAAAALNVLAVFLLGRALFGCARTGLLTALFWASSPAATMYAPFAQDVFYALFFHLALWLTWRLVEAPRGWMRPLAWGGVMACLVWLTFSWCIVAAVFAVFLLVCARRERGSWRELAWRGALPLGLMTGLAAWPVILCRLNYLALYRTARHYHEAWYAFSGFGRWLLALAGGQLELVVMTGALAAALVGRGVREQAAGPQDVAARRRRTFLWTLLGVYALPVLFGPNPLKLETARCWIWIPAVPLAFAAHAVLRGPRPARAAAWAAGVSAASGVLLRIFMDFGV